MSYPWIDLVSATQARPLVLVRSIRSNEQASTASPGTSLVDMSVTASGVIVTPDGAGQALGQIVESALVNVG
jgi:hypothetical protein